MNLHKFRSVNIQEGTFSQEILKWKSGQISKQLDKLALEEPLEIVTRYRDAAQDKSKVISITMRTPGCDKDLIIGFLFNENIITSKTDILEIDFKFNCNGEGQEHQTAIVVVDPKLNLRIESLDRHFYTNSSCGVCGKTAIDLALDYMAYVPKLLNECIDPSSICELPEKLRSHQTVFHETGGIHACGIFDLNQTLIHYAEDVGRHNAMDKLTGFCLTHQLVPAADHILVLSGRASFELIQKAMSTGFPIVISVGAPSHLAVELARISGMTLIGFVKKEGFNIYSGDHRIKM
ncbi:MAG: formate dehydrogenase accessory sulfurtransferase FdhD [Saprospiraceae bacterium]|nr:formate dehydrogenase accessory sulfurtransferase FdhD [Saprospiraceae bacterium]